MLSPLEDVNEFSQGQVSKRNSDHVTRAMSVGGTIGKTVICMAVLFGSAWFAWQEAAKVDALKALIIMGVAGVLVLFFGSIIWLGSIKNPVMILLFSAFEGGFVGSIAGLLDRSYPGIAMTGLALAMAIFAVMLTGYGMRVFQVIMRGVDVFLRVFLLYLVATGLGAVFIFSGLLHPIAASQTLTLSLAGFSLIGILIVSCSIITQLSYIETGVDNRLEPEYEWLAAFSLVGALVWLLCEILRFLWRCLWWVFNPFINVISLFTGW